MQFKIILNTEKHAFGNALPLNYQYELSAVIYKILSSASEEYASWLHDNGFTLDGKRFKLFTYSRLFIPSYAIDKKRARIIINSDAVEWYVSFLPEESTEKFVQGVFMNQTFQLGNQSDLVQFHVQSIEVLPAPQFEDEMIFETLSPICISQHEDSGKTSYLSPSDEWAEESILSSLLNRYQAFYGIPYAGAQDFRFNVLNTPKSVLITFKANTPEETKVRGYMCRFKIKADKELMKIMYESGVGMKGSQGWGMVKTIQAINS
ncbi:CRISPR-associated endoribonuclease Cas6 [uncultured Bacteroides sp.]|uniref:CRISPR-associated endoribonuclease Cas6 n=1 Tax=uncultured Bacteroides sp. TaxID=162156 RepID=UPI002AABE8A6|nr:CRISPR-associated endoribonuclease Cas6 [uncultured Bacteroides sp.]